jgi:glycosyltransferase involved in cell wall biosynthesis
MSVRLSWARIIWRCLIKIAAKTRSCAWKPYSRLFLVSDSAFWVLSWEMRSLARIADRLGVRLANPFWQRYIDCQSVFYASHFVLLDDEWLRGSSRSATAYFHGRPGVGVREFDLCYENLKRHHTHMARIQVSHSEMREIVLETGIAQEKVFLIPIGIDRHFLQTPLGELKRNVRDKLGIPQTAVVVGSFQKDGVGWGKGLEPKWQKGPDIFVQVMARLKERVPELFVLLSGPARGYVKAGLEAAGVPYVHKFLKHYPDIVELYNALDLYLVASREEGGPKAVLESMACGVPLVTTRVGQAMDLVRHGENGWMTESEDVDGLVELAQEALAHGYSTSDIIAQARMTAEANTYEAQTELWAGFMDGFVESKL